MAIGLDDTLLTLSQAARLVPGRRAGRPTAPSTIFRWAQTGLRGVRLETIQIGGTKCTTQAALERFFARLAEVEEPGDGDGHG